MTFPQAIQVVFAKYAEFGGRAGRAEFWWWVLFASLVGAALNTLTVWMLPFWAGMWQWQWQWPGAGGMMWPGFDGMAPVWPGFSGLWGLAVLLPTLAVTVRRLRDAGYAWGHVFWILLPVAGLIILIVFCAQPTRPPAPGAGTTSEGPQRAGTLG